MAHTDETAPQDRTGAQAALSQAALSTQIAVGAAVLAVLLALGGLLWVRFGEIVYLERILGAIANCF